MSFLGCFLPDEARDNSLLMDIDLVTPMKSMSFPPAFNKSPGYGANGLAGISIGIKCEGAGAVGVGVIHWPNHIIARTGGNGQSLLKSINHVGGEHSPKGGGTVRLQQHMTPRSQWFPTIKIHLLVVLQVHCSLLQLWPEASSLWDKLIK